ncbi:metallophosphoesterase [Sphingosinicella sp. BN140058]|uniref:metallophosphoesterase family protein n=1 Tax=Sphingosinicella sp. BN140058 TaxID=1892855 RepID=UPI0010133E44|nr:metallophosphoesterase [Sphingosinicella sp. BN140058]QAY76912.1 metallophosphoesterase [Sphingosinicella sp. BN140058]
MSENTDTITVAAIGDLHVTDTNHNRYRDLFAEMSEKADVVALAGDLTNFGKVSEAEILAEDMRACTIPMVGVLGNHDYEAGQADEVVKILQQAGLTILDEQACVIKDVGFAGVKGFLGGFGRGELGAFGEDSVKVFVDESRNEARKLENALRSLRTDRAVAVLHYAPVPETVEGEPLEIFPFLGSSRLANAIDRFDNVKAVVHGHAHRGAYSGRTPRGVPVFNVAQFVVEPAFGRPYALLEI